MLPGSPAEIDVWVVEARLGGGGMSTVYRCHNRHARRILAAIKLLDDTLRRLPDARARFVREAEILFTLDHPNIVKVRNVRLDVEQPYLEMEWVAGESLEDMIAREGALPPARAVELIGQLAEALAYLHRRKIRHRDIKPANLILGNDGVLVLVDFGIAVDLGGVRITSSDAIFGTISYVPPEWGTVSQVDPKSWDLYSTGVVLYELLTGRHAFPVPREGDLKRQAVTVAAAKAAIESLDPGEGHHPALRSLVRQLTHRDPEKRLASARDVQDQLKRYQRQIEGRESPLAQAADRLRKASGSTTGSGPISEDTWNTAALRSNPLYTSSRAIRTGTPAVIRRVADIGTLDEDTGAALARSLAPRRPIEWRAAAGGAALAAATFAGMYAVASHQASGARDVAVVVVGAQAHTPISVRLAGRLPDRREGFTFHFARVPTGSAELAWSAGVGCVTADCPGTGCAPWCATGTATRDLDSGAGTLVITAEVTPAQPRPVAIAPVGHPASVPVRMSLDGARVDLPPGGVGTWTAVLPGEHVVIAESGECPDAARGCAAVGACPPGCVSWRGTVVVPVGPGQFQTTAPPDAAAHREDE